jgi:predicted AAA+ superfamily ATPase
VIQDSLKRLPGRRGRADQVDFWLRPLAFHDFCRLRRRVEGPALDELAAGELDDPVAERAQRHVKRLGEELLAYHESGGYLTAINDLESLGSVRPATLRVYSDWIRGDVLRLDRSERSLREVLQAISERYASQVTWNALAKVLSIDHPKTIAEYVGILQRMDAVLVVPALAEHARGPAPKKARKVFFADPFIHRAVLAWLGTPDEGLAPDARLQRDLEATFAAHVARGHEAYYWKGQGEIDVVWYEQKRLCGIEVKWSKQLRPADLKEMLRRRLGIIAARSEAGGEVDGVKVVPAQVALLRLARIVTAAAR